MQTLHFAFNILFVYFQCRIFMVEKEHHFYVFKRKYLLIELRTFSNTSFYGLWKNVENQKRK